MWIRMTTIGYIWVNRCGGVAVPDPVAGLLKRKGKQCNCKNSRCLKLYCECFASGQYCEPGVCNCTNCFNNRDNEQLRAEAVEATLERNPAAFRPKIATGVTPQGSTGVRHHKGCNCKKSGCLKKYCECFQAGIVCSEACKCVDCRNYEGCMELNAILAGGKMFGSGAAQKTKRPKYDPAPGLAYQQVPATTGRSFGAPAPSARLGPTLPPHRQSSQLPVSSYLPQPTTGYYEDTLPVLASPVLSRFPAIPAAPPSVVGDLKDLKSQGRQNAPPPDVATVPEFGVVTDDVLEEKSTAFGRMFAAPGASPGPVAYAPDFERSVLTELLTTLRNIATGITAKLQA